MEAKTYRKILNPGEINYRPSAFHRSEDVLIVERGNLSAKCRRSDIFKFVGLVSLVCVMFFCLSVYWMSVKNITEQSKEDLENLLAERESHMQSIHSDRLQKPQCSQEKVVGDCKAIIPRWFYDSEKDACSVFNYSGCNGTANNFETLEDCASSCISHRISEKQDICTLFPDSGPCRGSIVRYNYNHVNRLCEKFIYGGCGGNENNFRSVEECQGKCDNESSFKLASSSEEEDPCSLDPKKGPCRGSIPRWYFSKSQNICKKFDFGGCLANKNNFLNENDCLAKCGEQSAPKLDVCSLPIDAGNCKSLVPKFAFDILSKKCVNFNYSGCEGNNNRYNTLEECEAQCQSMRMDTQGDDIEEGETMKDCTSKPDSGRCRGNFPRYYFDGSECNTFVYGGCLGNNNNFETKEKCMSICSGDRAVE